VSDTVEQIWNRVCTVWDMSKRRPTLIKTKRCPVCDHKKWLHRDWKYHPRGGEGHRLPYRIDISIKCLWCGLILRFGVAVTEKWWNEMGIGYHESATWRSP
jgi:hypothetical protein